jgi:hypothetical protein
VAGHGELYKAYKYRNMGHALKTIIRTEGFRALYRGSLASFFKIPASMGLSYGLYDAVNRLVAAEGIRMYARCCHDVASRVFKRPVACNVNYVQASACSGHSTVVLQAHMLSHICFRHICCPSDRPLRFAGTGTRIGS